MDDTLRQLIKEYNDAGYKESCIREFSFLPFHNEIAGIKVNQFTPRMFMFLDWLDSPFIHPKESILIGDLLQFLYVVSVDYNPSDKDGLLKFSELHSDINVTQTMMEVFDYINDVRLDEPPSTVGESSNKRPYTAMIVPYIDMLASEYGWKDEYIMDLPFARMFQYVKAIQIRKANAAGTNPILFNKLSDKAQAAITQYRNENKG